MVPWLPTAIASNTNRGVVYNAFHTGSIATLMAKAITLKDIKVIKVTVPTHHMGTILFALITLLGVECFCQFPLRNWCFPRGWLSYKFNTFQWNCCSSHILLWSLSCLQLLNAKFCYSSHFAEGNQAPWSSNCLLRANRVDRKRAEIPSSHSTLPNCFKLSPHAEADKRYNICLHSILELRNLLTHYPIQFGQRLKYV